jgi:LacI family transcriptional regulator
MTKKPTIQTIADMAGVCIATVSRVINEKDNVRPDTRQRVLDLIATTGYRPSPMARGLVLRRSNNILLGLHNIADPYCSAAAQAMGSLCRQRGYGLLLGDWIFQSGIEAEYLQRVLGGGVDGLIVSPLPGSKNVRHYAELAKAHFPLVVIDNPPPAGEFSSVRYDDEAIARLAVDYLLAKGHRRIVFLGEQSAFPTGKLRLRGYLAGHQAAGVAVRPDYILRAPKMLPHWNPGVLDGLLRQPEPPTAIIAINEMKATVCLNMLLRLGRRVPGDVAVVALGDVLDEVFVPVPLTAVAFHHEEAMRHALDMLVELIEQPELRTEPPRHYVQEPRLVVRDSA